ncbi:MAG: TldD/PmbA family protein [Clostridia bacterium]|nr:TldD/PmbA family protein [Clostridia bacterium]
MLDINKYIDKLMNEAQKAGLNECEAYYTDGDSFRVMVNQGQVGEYKVNTSCGLSFRAKIDGQIGYSYTQAFDDAAIEMLIHQVKENAGILETKDEQFIFKGSSKYSELNTYIKKLDEATPEQKIKLALELEQKCLDADEHIKSVAYCIVQSGTSQSCIKNSSGLDLSFRSNGAVAFVMPVAVDGDKSYSGGYAINIEDFDHVDTERLVNTAVERALSQFGGQPVESGVYDVVFDYEAAGELLETFCTIFSAESAQKGYSLLAGKEGEKIASDIVNIIDDPLHPKGPDSAPFDAEGVATYTKNVVENGVLNTLLHNLKTANKANAESTGNASKGSYNSPVGISPSNFYIKPMNNSVDNLLSTLKNGLMITDLAGLHAVDTVSADFSLSAKGFVIKDGKKEKALEQVTISGNFYEFLKSIVMIGDDLEYGKIQTSSVASPSILVKNINVAGL